MRNSTDMFSIPKGFRYSKTYQKGKPVHDKSDTFSMRHPAMPLEKRAKIFSPFDALKGFNEAIAAKDIHYEERKSLSEEDMRQLNLKLDTLHRLTVSGMEARKNHVDISVTYFAPCEDMNNAAYQTKGTYQTIQGIVSSVNAYVRTIRLEHGSMCIEIPLDDIIEIESNVFDESDL